MTTKTLFVLAGAAASLSSVALADQPAVSRDEVRAIVSEMLSDAETRSSLLAGGGVAGYEKNFFIASSDNNFRLNFSGYSQWRYTASFRDNGRTGPAVGGVGNAPTGNGASQNDFENGFSNHRTYLQFDGNVINPDFKFVINGEFADKQQIDAGGGFVSNSGNFNLRDAFFSYNLGSGWWIKGGQFRLSFLKEENIADYNQMASERSVTNFVFTQGRSQGVEIGYRQDEFRFIASFNDGLQSLNTDFATAAGGPNYAERDYGFTGRIDWAFAGKLDSFNTFTSKQDDEFGGYIGGGVHLEDTSNTSLPGAPIADHRYFSYTVDGMLKGSGFGLYAAFIGSNSNFRPNFTPPNFGTTAQSSLDNYGLVVQGSWRFLKETEAFVRYDATFYDNAIGFGNGAGAATPNLGDDRQDFITFGVNHYFAGQAARLTVDAIIALQGTAIAGGAFANPGAAGQNAAGFANVLGTAQGLLPSDDNTSVAVRAQFQFMF